MIVTRVSPGLYWMNHAGKTVEIIKQDEFAGPDKWIARALWDRYLYTDPVPTYRDAKRSAQGMLMEAAQ